MDFDFEVVHRPGAHHQTTYSMFCLLIEFSEKDGLDADISTDVLFILYVGTAFTRRKNTLKRGACFV